MAEYSGCNSCPAHPSCTATYRGSRCAAIRESYGLGDQKTNADRIRATSDEELAEWLQGLKYSPSCDSKCHDDFEKYGEQRTYCVDCWLDWLQQEAEQ